MDAYSERIGNALRLEARRSSRSRWSWDALVARVARWVSRPFSWLA